MLLLLLVSASLSEHTRCYGNGRAGICVPGTSGFGLTWRGCADAANSNCIYPLFPPCSSSVYDSLTVSGGSSVTVSGLTGKVSADIAGSVGSTYTVDCCGGGEVWNSGVLQQNCETTPCSGWNSTATSQIRYGDESTHAFRSGVGFSPRSSTARTIYSNETDFYIGTLHIFDFPIPDNATKYATDVTIKLDLSLTVDGALYSVPAIFDVTETANADAPGFSACVDVGAPPGFVNTSYDLQCVDVVDILWPSTIIFPSSGGLAFLEFSGVRADACDPSDQRAAPFATHEGDAGTGIGVVTEIYMYAQFVPITSAPTPFPTPFPTPPTAHPTPNPTASPTKYPSLFPTQFPTSFPTPFPTPNPTQAPDATPSPTMTPSRAPSPSPTTLAPTASPVAPVAPPSPSPPTANDNAATMWADSPSTFFASSSFPIALLGAAALCCLGTIAVVSYLVAARHKRHPPQPPPSSRRRRATSSLSGAAHSHSLRKRASSQMSMTTVAPPAAGSRSPHGSLRASREKRSRSATSQRSRSSSTYKALAITWRCASCQNLNASDVVFCLQCGADKTSTSLAEAQPPPPYSNVVVRGGSNDNDNDAGYVRPLYGAAVRAGDGSSDGKIYAYDTPDVATSPEGYGRTPGGAGVYQQRQESSVVYGRSPGGAGVYSTKPPPPQQQQQHRETVMLDSADDDEDSGNYAELPRGTRDLRGHRAAPAYGALPRDTRQVSSGGGRSQSEASSYAGEYKGIPVQDVPPGDK